MMMPSQAKYVRGMTGESLSFLMFISAYKH